MTLATADHLATGCGLVDQAPPTPRNQDEDGIHPVEAREAGSARPTYTSLLDPRVRDWAQAEALLATYREYAQSMRLNAKPLEKEDCRRFLWDEVEDDEMIADDDGLWGGCRGNGLKRGRKMMSKKKTLKLEDYLEAYQDNFAQRLALELGENGDME